MEYLNDFRPDVKSSRIFATKKTGKLSRCYYNERLKRAVKKTDINKNITSHNLRHSTAVRLINEGINIITIKELLGHEDINTTATYLHSDINDIRRAVEVL